MEKKKLYPLTFGNSEGGRSEICDLAGEQSIVQNGWLAGNSITDLMETYMDRLVGDNAYYFFGRQFPLTIRSFNPGAKGTPLMVCPDDVTASERYDALGKAKFWYVAKAGKGAKMQIGLREDMSATDFYNACLDGGNGLKLNEMEIHAGDAFHIVPGIVHRAFGDAQIVEICEASELDFNLIDGGDCSEALAESLDFVRLEASRMELLKEQVGEGATRELLNTEQMMVSTMALKDTLKVNMTDFDNFIAYFCASGSAVMRLLMEGKTESEDYVMERGQVVLIPAEMADFHISPLRGGTVILEASVPARKIEEETAWQN